MRVITLLSKLDDTHCTTEPLIGNTALPLMILGPNEMKILPLVIEFSSLLILGSSSSPCWLLIG
jgi:hypothetical protein